MTISQDNAQKLQAEIESSNRFNELSALWIDRDVDANNFEIARELLSIAENYDWFDALPTDVL